MLNEVQRGTGMLHLDRITVTGKTLGESIQGKDIQDEEVIRRYENAHSKTRRFVHFVRQPCTKWGGGEGRRRECPDDAV